MTSSLAELEKLAMNDTVKFDLTREQRIPERLIQQYLFIPAQVKFCYLVSVIKKFLASQEDISDNDDQHGEQGRTADLHRRPPTS